MTGNCFFQMAVAVVYRTGLNSDIALHIVHSVGQMLFKRLAIAHGRADNVKYEHSTRRASLAKNKELGWTVICMALVILTKFDRRTHSKSRIQASSVTTAVLKLEGEGPSPVS